MSAAFIKVYDWAMHDDRLSLGELLVLGGIESAPHKTTAGESIIGIKSLARRLNRDRNNVRTWFQHLVELGLLVVTGSKAGYTLVKVVAPNEGGVASTPPSVNGGGSAAPRRGGQRPPQKKRISAVAAYAARAEEEPDCMQLKWMPED